MPGTRGEGAPEKGSFAALVEGHSRLVFRIALAIVRSPHDAEYVVRETFLQVYKGNRWRQIEDERGYLARVAWRLAVRQRKLGIREQELSPETRSREASPEKLAMDRNSNPGCMTASTSFLRNFASRWHWPRWAN